MDRCINIVLKNPVSVWLHKDDLILTTDFAQKPVFTLSDTLPHFLHFYMKCTHGQCGFKIIIATHIQNPVTVKCEPIMLRMH